jgi:hypothetical protein
VLPALDLLLLEWGHRPPHVDSADHLDRGTAEPLGDLLGHQPLLDHYTAAGTLTLLWDTDGGLPSDHPLRRCDTVVVAEATPHPRPGAVSLLLPVDDTALDAVDPAVLAARSRTLSLVCVGTQTHHAQAFATYAAPTAAIYSHLIAGHWPDTRAWPHLRFADRTPALGLGLLFRQALTTILLPPDHGLASTAATSLLLDAVLAGCLPLTPVALPDAAALIPQDLHLHDALDAIELITTVKIEQGGAVHVDLLQQCLTRLNPHRLSHQVRCIEQLRHRHPCGGER